MRRTYQHYLDMVVVLAQKEFKVRYKNSLLGFLWSLLNPLAYMLILTLVFSLLLRVNVPHYAAWVLIGLLIWRFFALGTNQGLFSIISNPALVTKVKLPRYMIVLSSNLAALFGASLEFAVFLPLLFVLGVLPGFYVLLLPVLILLEFCLIFGLSLSLATLNILYRDFYQLWDIALQLGFFLCPIVYDSALLPTNLKFPYSLNPITRLIEAARNIFLFHSPPSLYDFGIVVLWLVVFLLVGYAVFHALEDRLAEII